MPSLRPHLPSPLRPVRLPTFLLLLLGILLLIQPEERARGHLETPTPLPTQRWPRLKAALRPAQAPPPSTPPPLPPPLPPVPEGPLARMLEAVNRDRLAHGLPRVAWDPLAARTAQLHAEEMARFDYMSHWDVAGNGPAWRHSREGGTAHVMENVYRRVHKYADGRPYPMQNLEARLKEAQESLMASPGHRATILAPEHTHAGLAYALNPQLGGLYVVQLFVDHYVALDPLPAKVALNQPIQLRGRLLPGVTSATVNLAWEPFPLTLTPEALNETGVFRSPGLAYQAVPVPARAWGYFDFPLTLDYRSLAGVYSLRIWARVNGRELLATEYLIPVR